MEILQIFWTILLSEPSQPELSLHVQWWKWISSPPHLPYVPLTFLDYNSENLPFLLLLRSTHLFSVQYPLINGSNAESTSLGEAVIERQVGHAVFCRHRETPPSVTHTHCGRPRCSTRGSSVQRDACVHTLNSRLLIPCTVRDRKRLYSSYFQADTSWKCDLRREKWKSPGKEIWL